MRKLLLIDANSLIHRSFHALPPFTSNDGQATGALYGLSSILIKILNEEKPDFIAACFDRPEPTFRKEIFEAYKIQRPKAPDELVSQIIEAHNLFQNFGVKTLEAPGFEADDLIGSAVHKFKKEKDLEIEILTGDLDTLQLIHNQKIGVKTFKKGVSETVVYDEAAVKERYGVSPEQITDYKALVGDASDNVPGVIGIGPKTATAILQKYNTIQKFLEKGEKEKAYEKIKNAEGQFDLAKNLVTIRNDAPIAIENLDELRCSGFGPELVPYFEKLGFKSLINRLGFDSPKAKKDSATPLQKKLF